jgi:replicative superfamily II helicase
MTFRGVFIGIDKYSPPITRLSCARSDALALSSLFEDTLGGEVRTILDQDASRAAIVDAITDLQSADSDDLVVIAFSGHGTEDHRLVPVDADINDLADTSISLDEVASLLDQVPARHLIAILDCCFSGGFGGARVFAPTSTRSVLEDRSSVEALAAGSGRIVLTASGAGEPALETIEFGHGLLTNYLVNGLQGKGGLGSDGRVSLYVLFQYVTREVIGAADRMRLAQTPTVYGSLEGAPSLTVLTAGARYSRAFPERVRAPVTAEWASLVEYGFTNEVLNAWAMSMPGPNALQMQAVNSFGVLDGKSILVVAPTGAGKTMIGELAALRSTMNGSRSVMLLPLKALVNDKYEYMTRTYGQQVKVIRATGDNGDQVGDLLSGQYDLALLTYEKFMSLALGNPHIMRGLSVVVVDEVQVIGDPNRGPSLEFLLTLLRSGHGRLEGPQIVALSAVIGDTRGFERWLGGSLLKSIERPVPLRESVVDGSGSLRSREPNGAELFEPGYVNPQMGGGSQSSKPWIIPLVRRLVSENKKVIVFRATKGDTVGTARYLAEALGLPPATDALNDLPQRDQSTASADLRSDLQAGVGFHNADLDREERAALESAFRNPDSGLRVLAATTTLAMGINSPAEAVVIAGLTHPQGDPYTAAEYKNMAGRAGRLGHVEAGEAYIVATGDIGPDVAWQRYVNGSPEAIASHFLSGSSDPQTLIVRSLAALGSTVEEADLLELLDNSFAIWLRREAGQQGWDAFQLEANLQQLTSGGLVDREPNGKLTLTALGRYAGESGIEVRSITNIASALRFAPGQLNSADVVTLAQVAVEMDNQYIPSNRRSHKEKNRWPATLQQLGVSYQLLNALHVGGGELMKRSKCAVACLLFASDRPMSDIEQILMQHLPNRSAAGNIRAVASRTRDVIDAVIQVATFNGLTTSTGANSEALGLQLEFGIPEEMVPLAQLLGTELNRGQYLVLHQAGIRDPDQLSSADKRHLGSLLGEDLAARVLQMLGSD